MLEEVVVLPARVTLAEQKSRSDAGNTAVYY